MTKSPAGNARSSTAKKWSAYCAAGTAAVSASIGTSEGAVVFVDFNDTVLLDLNTGDTSWTAFSFDLNGDAQADFRLWQRLQPASANLPGVALFTAPVNGSNVVVPIGVMGTASGTYKYPGRLPEGTAIDGSAAFLDLNAADPIGSLAWGNGYPGSEWVAPGNSTGYVGMRFTISGQSHFGWVRLTVGPNTGPNFRQITLHDAAFESAPLTGLLTGAVPEPGCLGLLALGSVGLLGQRRRRTAA